MLALIFSIAGKEINQLSLSSHHAQDLQERLQTLALRLHHHFQRTTPATLAHLGHH